MSTGSVQEASERAHGVFYLRVGVAMSEKLLKASWHGLIALVGVYELRNHKTKVSKVLACGLIAFHCDAVVSDYLDQPTLLQKILMHLRA